jgi:hypothetical protein
MSPVASGMEVRMVPLEAFAAVVAAAAYVTAAEGLSLALSAARVRGAMVAAFSPKAVLCQVVPSSAAVVQLKPEFFDLVAEFQREWAHEDLRSKEFEEESDLDAKQVDDSFVATAMSHKSKEFEENDARAHVGHGAPEVILQGKVFEERTSKPDAQVGEGAGATEVSHKAPELVEKNDSQAISGGGATVVIQKGNEFVEKVVEFRALVEGGGGAPGLVLGDEENFKDNKACLEGFSLAPVKLRSEQRPRPPEDEARVVRLPMMGKGKEKRWKVCPCGASWVSRAKFCGKRLDLRWSSCVFVLLDT